MNDNTMAQVIASLNGFCSPQAAQQFLAASSRQQQQQRSASEQYHQQQQAAPFLMHALQQQQQQQHTDSAARDHLREQESVLPSTNNIAEDEDSSEADNNKVVHDYHDRSGDPDGDYVAIHEMLQKSGGACVDQSFPVKLHYMLNEIEKDGLSDIVSWQPHGRAFVVHNQKLFVEQVLGSWFRQKKYPSFQRQLNIYGFHRLTTGPDKGGYYHELFLRSKPGLAYRIQRHKLKGTGTRKAASPQTEPNFYAMEPLPKNSPSKGGRKQQPQASSQANSPEHGSRLHHAISSSGGASDAVTLQNLAPSLFSPASFETSVQMMPNHQAGSSPGNQRGFRVTSTNNLTLKHNPADEGHVAAQPLNLSGAMMNSRLNRNNSAFLAALNGGALPQLGGNNNSGGGADINHAGSVSNGNNTPLWFLR